MLENTCKNCFEKADAMPCPHCGYNGEQNEDKEILPVGTVLNGRYFVGKKLGRGGHEFTYLAMDSSNEKQVCIKEFFPMRVASRSYDRVTMDVEGAEFGHRIVEGKKKFIQDSEVFHELKKVADAVDFYDCFQENNTVYIVTERLKGRYLKTILFERPDRKISFDDAMYVMNPIMSTIEKMHSMGYMHRDISPHEVFLTDGGKVKLFGFDSMKHVNETSKTVDTILRQGYAPIEQYSSKGKQGTWTDVYAIAATMLYLITGETPVDALDRISDNTGFENQLKQLPAGIGNVIRKATVQRPENRIQTVKELKIAFDKFF